MIVSDLSTLYELANYRFCRSLSQLLSTTLPVVESILNFLPKIVESSRIGSAKLKSSLGAGRP